MFTQTEELIIPEKQTRIPSIDRFRGLAMSLLIMFGAAIMFETTQFFKPLTTHDLSIAFQIIPGYALYDFGAPLFLFASGLSFGFAFASAERKYGTLRAYDVLTKRAIKIVGMGALLLFDLGDVIGIICFALLMTCIVLVVAQLIVRKKNRTLFHIFGETANAILLFAGWALLAIAVTENVLLLCGVEVTSEHWGALPSIGCAMLLAVPFVKLKPSWKVLTVSLLTMFYFSANLAIPVQNFTHFAHGGMLGSIGYALCFLYADLTIDLYKIYPKRPIIPNVFATLMAVMAFMSNMVALPSKAAVNVSYILISFVLSYGLYVVIRLFDDVQVKRFPFLTIIGQNCLLVYALNFFVTYVYGICINAMVDYVPVGGEGFHIFLCFVGMSWYPLLMAAGLKSLNAKGVRLKL